VTHAVVHRALWEYLTAINTSPEADQEKLRREIFDRYNSFKNSMFISSHGFLDSCQEVLAEMVHTKDGSRVVREFLAQGTAKVSSCRLQVKNIININNRIGNKF